MKYKGQVAIEFITTYGWAFLVMMLAIFVASSFGVFDSGAIVPDRCTTSNDFRCEDFRLYLNETTNEISFDVVISNRVGSTIEEFNLVGLSVENFGSIASSDLKCDLALRRSVYDEQITIDSSMTNPADFSWRSSDDAILSCAFSETSMDVLPGSRIDINIEGEYMSTNDQFPNSMNARMFATIES